MGKWPTRLVMAILLVPRALEPWFRAGEGGFYDRRVSIPNVGSHQRKLMTLPCLPCVFLWSISFLFPVSIGASDDPLIIPFLSFYPIRLQLSVFVSPICRSISVQDMARTRPTCGLALYVCLLASVVPADCGGYAAFMTDVGTQLIVLNSSGNLTYSPCNSGSTPKWSTSSPLILPVSVAPRAGSNIAAVGFTADDILYVRNILNLPITYKPRH